MDNNFSIDDYRSIREHLEIAWDILEEKTHSGVYTNKIEHISAFSKEDRFILNAISLALNTIDNQICTIRKQLSQSVDPYTKEATNEQ